jgi:hypothetical protein
MTKKSQPEKKQMLPIIPENKSEDWLAQQMHLWLRNGDLMTFVKHLSGAESMRISRLVRAKLDIIETDLQRVRRSRSLTKEVALAHLNGECSMAEWVLEELSRGRTNTAGG